MYTQYILVFWQFSIRIVKSLYGSETKEPAIIFMVTGIIPLVPGGLAYDATKI